MRSRVCSLGGSVSDPMKTSHAELGAADDENDRELAAADTPVANSRSLSQGPSLSSASRGIDFHLSPSHSLVAQHIPPETPPTSSLASPVVRFNKRGI